MKFVIPSTMMELSWQYEDEGYSRELDFIEAAEIVAELNTEGTTTHQLVERFRDWLAERHEAPMAHGQVAALIAQIGKAHAEFKKKLAGTPTSQRPTESTPPVSPITP